MAFWGPSDWSYILPNGYEIWHFNAYDISVVYQGEDKAGIQNIGPYVTEFAYNERYVCLKLAEVPEDHKESIDKANIEYTVLDTLVHELYDQFDNENDYLQLIETLGITALSEWESTSPAPNRAIFGTSEHGV